MRFSSSFKVGILTLVALLILLFTILWVKGRSFSSGERIEIQFKDVNGLRPGSAIQMMGLRIGQVEEIIPVINGDNSYVKLRFVITEPGITVPKASIFSIQQSGLIGEQFLEITPPKTKTTYVQMTNDANLPYKNDPVQLKLGNKYYDVGKVKATQILSSQLVPPIMKEGIKTRYAYRIDYIIDMPGLILPEYMKSKIVSDHGTKKMLISMLDNTVLPYPQQTSPYTVIEPMRIADFMDLQYKAAESLTETTLKVNELLSDNVIVDLKQSVANINVLTAKATTTITKAEKLIDSSKADIDSMIKMVNEVGGNINLVTKNINGIIGDEKFKTTIASTATSIDRLSNNLNKVLDNTDAKQMASDLQSIIRNLNDISSYVSSMTKDEKLKAQLSTTITTANKAMSDISSALDVVNTMTPAQKCKLQQTIEDAAATTHNLKKFTDKLNKRFLLFRLMF